ncbi:MAG: hypothetical protein LAP85_14060 [Acidobacteriia bacterium]|nr:hypothetical protein [Terriglobia bacterium]
MRSGPGVERSRQEPPQPLVRPAPPVRPPTPSEQADRQAKQKAWENAHPRNNQSRNKK